MSCVTIYTDASFDAKTKAAGWGCWIKDGRGETSSHSGAFKTEIHTAAHAEMMAIANAIFMATRIHDMDGSLIVIVTDCQMAINVLMQAIEQRKNLPKEKIIGFLNKKITTRDSKTNKTKRNHQAFMRIAHQTIDLIPPEARGIKINKVKAHYSGDGKRSYINNKVDKLAKNSMRKNREEKIYG